MNIPEEQKNDPKTEVKQFQIYVNTRKETWDKKEITFREAVKLAFPKAVFNEQHTYTIVYSKGIDKKPKGTMVDGGDSVHVKDGMVFDIEHADRS